MPIEGPAIIAASWFAPSGAPIESTAPVRRLTHGGATVGWVIPAGEHWSRPHDDGPGLEVDGVLLRGAYDLVTALERLLTADCADFRAAPSAGVPEGSIVLGDPADVISLRATVEPGVVFDVRQRSGGDRGGRRGAERHPAGGTDLHRQRHPGARRVHPRVGVRTRVPGARRDRRQRVPGLRQQGARRVHRPQRRGPLGQPRRRHHDLESEEHLRARAAGGRTAPGSRPAGPTSARCSATTPRPRSAPCCPTGAVVGAGANVFGAPHGAEVRAGRSPGAATGSGITEEGFLTVARRVLARRDVAWSEARQESLRRTYAPEPARRDGALRARVGLARQLLRGGARRDDDPDRRRVQPEGDRAAGGDHRPRPGHGRRDRPDPRAWRSRARRRPAGPAARRAGAHGARHLDPARAAGCGTPSTARSGSAPGWRSDRSW